MSDKSTPLRVDIVSDVVCPWCAIGYHQLAAAARATGTALEIHWHPFELNPAMPRAGQNLREHLAEKYGTTPDESEAARERLTTLGAEVGFDVNFTEDTRIVNTFQAHQLIDWAEEQGQGHEAKLALLAAYFSRGLDVSDPEVLADIAAGLGLDRAGALAMLDAGDRSEKVREKERLWTDRGVQGVPAMIFASKYLVTGAQGVDGYVSVLRQLQTEPAR